MAENLSPEFEKLIDSITSKRAKTVVQHIKKHGSITSQDLKETYGYDHPPRAIRDVRELGIPIDTYRVKDCSGKSIAAYRFGDCEKTNTLTKAAGRTVLSKALKHALIEKYGSRCFIYLEPMEEASLQVDHRIPYEIGGEGEEQNIDAFMLLSPSANRMKSWTCEHCPNWTEGDPEFCTQCFWANPEDYTHVAGKEERVLNLFFSTDEIDLYDRLIESAAGDDVQKIAKEAIRAALDEQPASPHKD